MKRKILHALRILFAIFCIFFGVNKFGNFLDLPAIEGDGGTLMGIYAGSGFFMIIGALEIIFGITLLLRKYVQLSLIILLAIMFNAFIFHALHDIGGIAGATFGCLIGGAVAYGYRRRFKGFLIA